ncbi:MAG: hypothetical protein ACO2PL_14245 [Armatimonadota bacterium]
MEKGSLSVALWMAIAPLKAKAQTNDPPPSGSCYVFSPSSSSVVEYSRRGMIVWEITPTSATDYDFTPWGLEENFVVIVGWTDFMEGEDRGEFGYSPDGYSFYPVNNPEWVNAYRPKPGFVGVLRIAPILDDIPIGIYSGMPTYDDDPVTGEPWKMTVWEFEIDPPYIDALPQDGAIYTFTATIQPPKDHNGRSMARFIEFWLYSSAEPGYCLNATRVDGLWTDTSPEDNDLKFVPYQPGLEVYAHPFDPNPTNFCYAVTTQPVLSASVEVMCLDYGANGIVLAYVYGLGPNLEPARVKGYLDRYAVRIPKDEDDNLIWDGWEWNNGGTLDDNDAEPPGDGTLGDGLTRYEEYRGLEVNGLADDNSSMSDQVKHQRLNPTRKDMFVVNGVRYVDGQFGAGYFPGAGMPNTWLVDFDRLPDQDAFVINFFSSPSVRIRPVYGIRVLSYWRSEPLRIGGRIIYGFCTQPIWSGQRVNEPLPVSGTGPSAVYFPVQIREAAQNYEAGVRYVIGHEIGHSVLWYQPDTGHHAWLVNGQQVICLMSIPADFNISPSEFCAQVIVCQTRWKLNP